MDASLFRVGEVFSIRVDFRSRVKHEAGNRKATPRKHELQ